MDLLYKSSSIPSCRWATAPDLLVQTLWEGLVAGVLYSLIALGFVLIFKASGVFNFAQGIMVVFAALTLVGLYDAAQGACPGLSLASSRSPSPVMFALALARRAAGAAAAGQPARHHPVHGDLRAHLFSHRVRRAGVRRQSQGDDLPTSSTCRSGADRVQDVRRLRVACRRSTSRPR